MSIHDEKVLNVGHLNQQNVIIKDELENFKNLNDQLSQSSKLEI